MICEEFKEYSSITPHSSISVLQQSVISFESTISAIINLCIAETIFLAAVSGGADSVAMLTALSVFVPKERLYCLHIEHGIRPSAESKGDADFVSDYCQKLGIECHIVSIPQGKISSFADRKGIGIEAAARFFRRKFFFSEAKRLGENTRILIAHTKDDLLETVLMRVIRGCGPAGLAMMPAEKRIILRPLLSLSREEVLCYLKAKGVFWREDSTNGDERFLRNRIRRQLVPLLNGAFPSWKTGISGMAETQSLAADFIAEEAKKRISWNFGQSKYSSSSPKLSTNINSVSNPSLLSLRRRARKNLENSASTDENNFFSQPLIVREESLFLAIDRLLKDNKNMRSIKRSVVRRFCSGSVTAADLGQIQIRRGDGKVLLLRKQKEFFEKGISLLI